MRHFTLMLAMLLASSLTSIYIRDISVEVRMVNGELIGVLNTISEKVNPAKTTSSFSSTKYEDDVIANE